MPICRGFPSHFLDSPKVRRAFLLNSFLDRRKHACQAIQPWHAADLWKWSAAGYAGRLDVAGKGLGLRYPEMLSGRDGEKTPQ